MGNIHFDPWEELIASPESRRRPIASSPVLLVCKWFAGAGILAALASRYTIEREIGST